MTYGSMMNKTVSFWLSVNTESKLKLMILKLMGIKVWTHVTVCIEGGESKVYIDGERKYNEG